MSKAIEDPPQGWTVVGNKGALHRRFEFENYAATSRFLDRLAKLSERTGRYPDLNFASRHVNVSIRLDAGWADDAEVVRFAEEVTALSSDTRA